jgi:hypothetical protein
LDKWQINNKINVNFTVDRIVFVFSWIIWVAIGYHLSQFGFGEDTDAWLMSQTAQKLANGENYDPARSLGNPLYEYLLVLLQPGQNWFYSNLLSLCLGSLFLFRLSVYFPVLIEKQVLALRLCLMALPIFNEAASSSMEFMVAWLLFAEIWVATKQEKHGKLWILSFLLVFIRPEFFPFLMIGLFYSKKLNSKSLFPAVLLFTSISIFAYWSMGKNPAPFTNWVELIQFYGGRMLFLARQAEFLLPFYIFLILGCGIYIRQKSGSYLFVIPVLALFIIFPFEWAYGFFPILFGLAYWISTIKTAAVFSIPLSALAVSCLHFSGTIVIKRPNHIEHRIEMTRLYHLAQVANFETPTLLLFGATYFPTNSKNWEKSLNNRLFRRKGTNFFVGERLKETELDSIKDAGFQLIGIKEEKGRISEFNNKIHWIHKNEIEKILTQSPSALF